MVCAGVERLFDFLARLVPGVHTNTRGECIETGRRSKREAKQGNGEARLSQGKERRGEAKARRLAATEEGRDTQEEKGTDGCAGQWPQFNTHDRGISYVFPTDTHSNSVNGRDRAGG
ncbi:hypothetical protein G6O67_005140 [Ophiocordyceps sinensis]|uniref:Uncharacterized protein n=1 Tax=Ophiocordyceps sinensis TaxID=72228 RepID=A0A8H4V5V9_9HYPO|nr:hypothetical protein G6O67_005140 [Ophiocordyceps sinensis]